jgi:4-hydroxybenzoate polyprenyltransferase
MQKVIAFFKLIRYGNLLIMALSLVLFYYCILLSVHRNILHTTLAPFNLREFVLFVLSVISVAAAGNIINDYYDFELDKEFKPNRPLPSGGISLDAAIYWHGFLALLGIALGFYLGWTVDNYKIGYVYVICVLLLLVYSAFLKKIPLAGNLLISGLTAFIFVLLVIFEASYLKMIDATNLFESTGYAFGVVLWQLKFYASFALLTGFAREVVKDLEDKEGDTAFNINTFAVAYGELAGKIFAAGLLVLLLLGLGYFMNAFYAVKAWLELTYLAFALALPVLVVLIFLALAKTQKDYSRISLMLKIIILLGVISMAVFYFLSKPAAA